jgi:thiamine-monophosphate kinase
MSLSEFELIRQYFSNIQPAGVEGVALGVGDDCALLDVPAGQQLALSIDTLVAGVHFPVGANPYDIACRSVAVTVSDLAAMGARPLAFTLALSLPEVDEPWLQAFSQGLRDSAGQYQLALVGGDTTKGPLTITIQVHGLVSAGKAITRSGAGVDDLIVVSGCLGDGRAALHCLSDDCSAPASLSQQKRASLLERFYRPTARVELGRKLTGLATAAIDISDGLLADLGHIARASGLTAELDQQVLPYSEALQQWPADVARTYALSGGDDYELCFTVPAEALRCLQSQTVIPLTVVGRMLARGAGDCVDPSGRVLDQNNSGYKHF